jgi:nicotinate dehydrogenase subunit B
MTETLPTTRRAFGAGLGALVVTFSLKLLGAAAQVVEGPIPRSFAKNRHLEGWIRVASDNTVTVFTGKAELGQGILTALAQIAAEELDVDIEAIRIVSADTARGPDEGYTYGSQSIEESGSAIRAASAQARAALLAAAAARLNVDVGELAVESGIVKARDGRQVSYGVLAANDSALLRADVAPAARLKNAHDHKIVGRSVRRIDLPKKIMAEACYVQDMRLPGMVYGRAIRPPRAGANLLSFDEAAARKLPCVVAVVRDGSFLAIAATREEHAIAAMQSIKEGARWSDDGPGLPDGSDLPRALKRLTKEDIVVDDRGRTGTPPQVQQWVEASYSRPYLSHAVIGPSCAVAQFSDGHMTVWSHSQGAFPLRADLARVLGLPIERVDVIHVPGSGCYGHNGADDVALDAALLARGLDGRPVKLQWMRDDEFGWSPASPAMVMHARAGLSSQGKIVDWTYELWSNTHATRPGQPGGTNLLASWYLEAPFHVTPPLKIPQPYGNGDRNAVPLYDIPRRYIVNHLLTEMPLRTSSLRTLGGHGNIFAIECFMDELAAAAGRDAVEFRLMHMSDPRGRAVIEAAAARAKWRPNSHSDGRQGRGFAYTRYKNISTYAAVVMDIELDRASGAIRLMKATAAVDAGQIINPDGAISQSEGGIVQGLSLALKEQLTFDHSAVTSRDWAGYPIMTFEEVPPIEVVLIDRPEEPSIGTGEGTVGPASAALANAVAHVIGKPVRDLPLTRERVLQAL